MFTRRMYKMKPVIAVPKGSIVPAGIDVPVIADGTFIEKLVANGEHQIAILMLTTEELIALVEKPHLFGIDVIALVGVPGGRYDAVWSQYIAPLRRVSLDTLDAEVQALRKLAVEEGQAAAPKVRTAVPENDDDESVLE